VLASDKALQSKWRAVKLQRKAKLAELVKKLTGDDIDINSMFDIQIKRIHEYKRQYLNVLSIIWRYKQLKKMTPAERKNAVPRVCMIGGKAASAYDMAKRIIRLVSRRGSAGRTEAVPPASKAMEEPLMPHCACIGLPLSTVYLPSVHMRVPV